MFLNFEILILLVILLLTFFILFSTIKTNISNVKNQRILFSFILVTVIVWVVSILVTDLYSKNYNISLWASRISFFSSALIALCYFSFVKTFESKFNLRLRDIFIYALGAFFATISLTSYVLESVTLTEENLLQSDFGRLYIAFSLYISLVFVYSTIHFYRIYRKEEDTIRKSQILSILIGSTLSIFATLITNILFPILGLPEIRSLGPITLIFFLTFTYYAILRYRFLSINTLIGKIIYVLVIGLFPLISFFVIYYIQITIWGSIFRIEALASGFIISIFIVYLFLFTNKKLNQFINNIIINRHFDPSQLKDQAFKKLSTELDISKISEIINIELIKAHLSESVHFTVIDKDSKSIKYSNTPIPIKENILSILLSNYHKTEFFIKEELRYSPISNQEELLSFMSGNNTALYFVTDKSLNNILIIDYSNKENKSKFTIEDIDLISSISSIIAVSVDRAILYKQVNEYAKELQNKINEATRELKEKNTELSDSLRKERDMMDILGHELRTPLSIARNALATLEILNNKENYLITKEELKSYLDKSLEAIRREIKILQTVLSSTRIENNRIQMNIVEVDCNDVVHDSVEGLKDEANKKKLELSVSYAENKPLCMADREKMQEVIDNILDNAIKYTDNGSVSIRVEENNDYIIFEIKDTGEGIPEQEIPNLGKKFHRVNMYGKDTSGGLQVVRPGGTGIGLYVVYNLVKMMSGKIEVKSKVGVGTTFSIFIPSNRHL